MEQVRILALDIGEKRVGVAISDPMGWTAQGLEVVQRAPDDQWLERIQQVITDYEVEKIVIGLPRNMDGTIGPRGEACKELGEHVQQRFQLPVVMWDERLSTVAVERTLISADMSRKKRKKVVDQLAASWILQGYLDAQRGSLHD
ncbi:Holliday junction resolvase RuvX [Mechercharimyces sp. CAU 1602]|uniref:Holliday junction resolvase RuvX n=1 Tax=Mechercharimyces sp. CAU 1602 TaxID=2973933 RepID=UPI0021637541|nr:Holliday junction resolvase RuvX [Mechercharimyces sp. CAU 1602]MCS1350263.1 Holliday junction resolvase RuvX [Mechercharimyces sp. CAU 1602]